MLKPRLAWSNILSNNNGCDYSQLARINLQLPKLCKKPKVTIMGNGWDYSSTIMTRIDSICSNIDFPTIVKTYYRPQLQRNPYVDDSFLITSLDNPKDIQFNKLSETIDMKAVDANNDTSERINKINIIKNKHSSITFASVFKNQSLSQSSLSCSGSEVNRSKNNSVKIIESVDSFHRSLDKFCF